MTREAGREQRTDERNKKSQNISAALKDNTFTGRRKKSKAVEQEVNSPMTGMGG